jgi:hypothetical protein
VQWWYGESGERRRLIGDGTKSRKGPLGVTQEILLKHIALTPAIQSDLNKMDTERKERSISHTAGSEVFLLISFLIMGSSRLTWFGFTGDILNCKLTQPAKVLM